RVRLGDVDGSGPADLVYLGRQQVRWWPNQAGNGFGAEQVLDAVPPVDSLTRIELVDLLGTGTSCLVWASPLHRDAVRYLDLSRGTDTPVGTGGTGSTGSTGSTSATDPAGRKPRLLTGVRNNFGAETAVQYAASTVFYLADRDSGTPSQAWTTRLPFPVQVVASTTTTEAVSGTVSGCRYSYRHGYFDGAEREFRGFGMVQTQDTQAFPASPSGDLATPPVRTRSWFHTGGYRSVLTDCYTADPLAVPLFGPILDGLAGGEDYRQALRALAGVPLRTEIYADDATAQAQHPYSVTEHRYRVLRLQPAAEPGQDHFAARAPWTQWAAFTKHELETVVRDYERDPADPRTSHALTLDVDDHGVVRSSAAVGYRRRTPQIPEQQPTPVLWTSQNTVTTDTADALRLGVPIESRIFEITGLPDPGTGCYTFEAVRDAVTTAAGAEIPYETTPAPGAVHARCVEHTRTRYWSDDLTTELPAGQVGIRALPHHTERVAFTPGLLTAAFGA
ncbi:MAG TPA: toxin TcdB middle/N-terminal domain-containing protein, partial [Trebonia sp.]